MPPSSTTRKRPASANRPSTGSAPTWPCAKQLESGKPADRAEVQQAMLHWQKGADPAGICDAAALAKLPADEQKACTQLWADVGAMLKTAEEKPK